MAGEEIDADIAAAQRARTDRVGVGEVGNFDSELYGGAEKGGEGYATELVDEEDAAAVRHPERTRLTNHTRV